MSIHAYAWAWAQSLDPSEKLLLLALADHLNSETNHAFPSVRRLMKFTGLSERHVRRCLASLEAAEYIEKAESFNDRGRQISNTYRFRTEVRPLEIGRSTGEDGSDLKTSRSRFERTLAGGRPDSGVTPSPDLLGMVEGAADGRGEGANGGTPISVISKRNNKPSSDQGKAVALRAPSVSSDDWPADAWDQFWQAFPNKVGKPVARKALDKARHRCPHWDDFWAGLQRYVKKTDDRAWLNPATFLNQDRWADQPAMAAAGSPAQTASFFSEAMGGGNARSR
jgi:hypothetical protein